MSQIFLGNTLISELYVGNIFSNAFQIAPQTLSTSSLIEYLVVAGGGGAGSDNAGGGGAGGLLSGSFTPSTSLTFTTILGVGGAANVDGVNSSISSSLFTQTSIGGGRGGGNANTGSNGGSGGGGGYFGGLRAGGLGTVGQGRNGATGSNVTNKGGGGGGAATAATNENGGSGSQWLDGNFYAGGGGGGANNLPTSSGGIGGGGRGGIKFNPSFLAQTGSANTGGGGGGDASGAAGGSGIIIFRYETLAYPSGSIAGGDSIITSGSYNYHRFLNVATSSLTITI